MAHILPHEVVGQTASNPAGEEDHSDDNQKPAMFGWTVVGEQ